MAERAVDARLVVAVTPVHCCNVSRVLGEAGKAQGGGSDAHFDPSVTAAVALGWEVSDLYAESRVVKAEPGLPATLPSVEDLSPRRRTQAGVAKVSVLLGRALGGKACKSGPAPSVEALESAPEGDAVAWEKAVYGFHVELVTVLQARDSSLFGAYDLGRLLADTCRDPTDLSTLMDRLEPECLLPIEGRLADLSSKLPAHSGAAVGATLEEWKAWTAEARARESMSGVRGALSRQGALWRALLTGEKAAREMLDPDMVVAASVRHASRLGTMIRGLASAFIPAVAVLALAAMLVLWSIISASGIATVIAALGALAATLLVMRKGIALMIEDTIGELRVQLWHSELDAAVAQSILRLPPTIPALKRPKLSLAKPPPGEGAPRVRPTFAQRLERALHVTTSAKKPGLRVPASGPASAPPQGDDGASANGGGQAT